jgi:hypothetical protein
MTYESALSTARMPRQNGTPRAVQHPLSLKWRSGDPPDVATIVLDFTPIEARHAERRADAILVLRSNSHASALIPQVRLERYRPAAPAVRGGSERPAPARRRPRNSRTV